TPTSCSWPIRTRCRVWCRTRCSPCRRIPPRYGTADMARYLVRSLVQLLLTVAGVMTVTFFLMRAIPGDPALYMLGDYATTDAVASLRAKLGLDRPLLSQYAVFVRQTVSGDLGNS